MNIDEQVILKVIGFCFAIWFIKTAWKIIAGKDGMQEVEFYKFTALFLFMFLFVYMIFKEGNRIDCNSHVYNEWYIGIVAGSLLTVLHLDSALENILKVINALRNKDTPK